MQLKNHNHIKLDSIERYVMPQAYKKRRKKWEEKLVAAVKFRGQK